MGPVAEREYNILANSYISQATLPATGDAVVCSVPEISMSFDATLRGSTQAVIERILKKKVAIPSCFGPSFM